MKVHYLDVYYRSMTARTQLV